MIETEVPDLLPTAGRCVEAGMNIKTRALRHEVHHVPSPEGFDYEQWGYQVSDHTNGIYFRPETGNSILVGSEDPESDERDWIDDPDDYNQNLNTEIWKLQVYRLAKRIPDLSIPAKPSGLVDLYDVTDDWIPIYDKSDLPGYYMAVGTSGNQFKNAGGVGHLVAELIDGCETGQSNSQSYVFFLTALGVNRRFILTKVGTKAFVRNRPAIEIPLSDMASKISQYVRLLRCLDTLSNNFQTKGSSELRHSANDRPVVFFGPTDKGLVDLQGIKR